MDRPAAVTAAGFTARPYHFWTGRSGRDYVHGVYALDEAPHFPLAAVVVVRREDCRRLPLLIGATGELPELFFLSEAYAGACAQGANEVHVHLATSRGAASAAAADLAPGMPALAPSRASRSLAGDVA